MDLFSKGGLNGNGGNGTATRTSLACDMFFMLLLVPEPISANIRLISAVRSKE